jgi:hypothetical protein
MSYRMSLVLLLGIASSAGLALADDPPGNDSSDSSASSVADSAPPAQFAPSTSSNAGTPAVDPDTSTTPPASSSTSEKSNVLESSVYSSFFMAGKTQDQFVPFTPKKRLKAYAESLFSPFHFFLAGLQAGISQEQDSPHEWGQGAEGYGKRFGNYYAEATTAAMLQMIGEDLLHEDNYYYGSGEHGMWKRLKYAVKTSVLARGTDGTLHFSISQVGSTAAASFISRLWQPPSRDSAADGAKNFGVSMATNAGVNVAREFLPDLFQRLFHREKQQHP